MRDKTVFSRSEVREVIQLLRRTGDDTQFEPFAISQSASIKAIMVDLATGNPHGDVVGVALGTPGTDLSKSTIVVVFPESVSEDWPSGRGKALLIELTDTYGPEVFEVPGYTIKQSPF